jgi:hypothetical protein
MNAASVYKFVRFMLSPTQALLCAVAVAAPATEVLVTTARFGDLEFDWGRDGVYCPSCNGGDGNNRFNWVDRQGRLWIGYIDHATGFIYPSNGRAVLVDSNAAYYSDFGNGPEWLFWRGDSQLVYTRYVDIQNPTPETTGVALATQTDGVWSSGFIDGGMGHITPAPSQTVDDPSPRMAYASATDGRIHWRTMGDVVGPEQQAPWRSIGLSVRWVPGSTHLAFVNGKPGADGRRYQQIFDFDSATNGLEQLSFEPEQKRGVFMFRAPEFGGDMTYFTVANRTELRVYRHQLGSDGLRRWTLVRTVRGPADAMYIATPEPFFHNGRTWVTMTLSSSNRASDITVPTDLALTSIDPARPVFRRLTDSSSPRRLRQDPEYYITAQGPFLYFTRAVPATASSGPVNEGVFRVDLGLGPAQP